MNDWILLAVFGFISILCLISMYRRKDSGLLRKILWTPVVMIPFAGPLFYLGFFRPPTKSGYRKNWPDDSGGMPPGGETAVYR